MIKKHNKSSTFLVVFPLIIVFIEERTVLVMSGITKLNLNRIENCALDESRFKILVLLC